MRSPRDAKASSDRAAWLTWDVRACRPTSRPKRATMPLIQQVPVNTVRPEMRSRVCWGPVLVAIHLSSEWKAPPHGTCSSPAWS